ncbi:hypothetical protein KY285_023460 [Solanum tuberosum]|nr:hypothetical protein KY285_023460 [Solanum tuberosum]
MVVIGHIPAPLYGNLSFTHNHNAADDVGRSVGGNSHIGTHTHGTVGFHGSSASRIPGFGVFTQASADMCIPGFGNTGTHGHGVGGINMAFTGSHSFEGIVNCSVVHNSPGSRWIVDTGATNHMTSTLTLLCETQYLPPNEFNKVYLPNGQQKARAYSLQDSSANAHTACINYFQIIFLSCWFIGKTRLPFPQSTSRSNKVFDLIHGDVWGPYRTPTDDGNRYFLTSVDDCSRMVWIFLLKQKSDVFIEGFSDSNKQAV